MFKARYLLAACLAVAPLGAAHAVATFTFLPDQFGAPDGYMLVNDFDTADAQSLVTTTGDVLFPTGNVPGRSTALPGNSTPYLSVGTGGAATIGFGSVVVRSFSFDFGTIDAFNELTINYSTGGSTTYTGSDILGSLPTGVTSGSIIVAGNGSLISSLVLASARPAFEVDNLAVSSLLPGAVPEPASWAMMVGGFGLLGSTMRNRRRVNVSFG
jgi:hypothetical protein